MSAPHETAWMPENVNAAYLRYREEQTQERWDLYQQSLLEWRACFSEGSLETDMTDELRTCACGWRNTSACEPGSPTWNESVKGHNSVCKFWTPIRKAHQKGKGAHHV